MFSFLRKTPKLPHQDVQDELVDGFVLLESETDKQNTVKPGDARNQDLPPVYNDLNSQSSSSTTYQSNEEMGNKNLNNLNVTSTNNTIPSNSDTENSDNYTLAIGDIPFQFSPSIKTSLFHKDLTSDNEYQLPNMMENMSDYYDYDFVYEKYIQENR